MEITRNQIVVTSVFLGLMLLSGYIRAFLDGAVRPGLGGWVTLFSIAIVVGVWALLPTESKPEKTFERVTLHPNGTIKDRRWITQAVRDVLDRRQGVLRLTLKPQPEDCWQVVGYSVYCPGWNGLRPD